MASERPPLQLQFAIQGGNRVLPLNTENVACVFQTGVLTKEDKAASTHSPPTFGALLGVPGNLINDPLSAAAWWVSHGRDPKWRVIIYNLDCVGETDLADELIPYSEPPSDSSLTVERVTPVFMNTRDWREMSMQNSTIYTYRVFTTIVPDVRANVIRRQYPSEQDQRRQGAMYYVSVYPWASWEDLAEDLYQYGENGAAVEVFKTQLPKAKDHTLTVETMLLATDGTEMPEHSKLTEHYFDMPAATYNAIVKRDGTGKEGRKQVLSEFLSHHPYPRWELVVDLLQNLEGKGKARAGLAQDVKEKHLISVRSLFTLCVGYIVNNYEFYQPLLPQLLPHRIYTHITSLPAWQQQEEEEEPLMLKRRKICVPDEEEKLPT